MHPAPSIILFTVLSGFGFGLISIIGLLQFLSVISMFDLIIYSIIGVIFATVGLVSSFFHLANKKNAIKSLSQWQTSWLSREAIASIFCLLVVFGNIIWAVSQNNYISEVGVVLFFLSLFTIFTTSMIYAQLKTVPSWNNALTPAIFVCAALTGGAILLTDYASLVLLLVFGTLQISFWYIADRGFQDKETSVGTALGYNKNEEIRPFDVAHTNRNYLLNEMVYKVARKHSVKIRYISFFMAFVFPMSLILIFPNNFSVSVSAITIHLIGIYFSRWLFFAEAKHSVSFYY
ncbi:MAG: DmsC/YnfH family molybdoenzyme membrane anchor subunit [Pseudomonadota bacterium]|jgi:DMSO reductase anchor subunit|nr:DmsC/YnfH family molybdoenzyme membrane anchor subunit [Pseudomonadota bacterium]